MAQADTPHRGNRFTGLMAGLAVAGLFLAGCVWWTYRELAAVIGLSKITGSISWGDGLDPVLLKRLAVFGLAVTIVHALFAVAGWGLARLTRSAFPGRRFAGRMSGLTAGWTTALFALVLVVNASWFPASRFASENSSLLAASFGITLADALMAVLAAMIAALLALAWVRSPRMRLPKKRIAVAVGGVALAWALTSAHGAFRPAPAMTSRPNIVILGIDSMRNDLKEVKGGETLTPHINDFLARSYRFSDTTTPLARTYPSWVAILTGRHPVSTNARFNLMPRTLVREGDTLADALDDRGYSSVFATDEVRFANFDGSYGFDELITPPIGASDFVIGSIGDLPAVNVMVGTRLGAWLFPGIHANRAASVTYRPRDFVARLDREIELKGPRFLAIHLTLAHWPYSWAGLPKPTTPQEYRPAYRHALQEVDQQFQDVLDLLGRKGVLDNAFVVVLSDHGEALGFPSDSMLRKTGTGGEIWDSLWGHGTSVMSPHQYSVVFAMRPFGVARVPGEPAVRTWPVSLEDVRPTLEELATGAAPRNVDGISLVPYLAGRAPASALDSRIRFTETCFNTIKLMAGKITDSGMLSEGAIYYELDPASGWAQLRPERLPEILAKKQRAALSRDSILAAIPSWKDDTVTYLYSERRSPKPRRLNGPPDPATEPEAALLWQALEGRFPGEVPAPAVLPRM